MYSNKSDTVCGKQGHTVEKCWACATCGKSGHTQEKCWTVIGFPNKNERGNREYKGKGSTEQERPQVKSKFKEVKGNQKWNKGKGESRYKMSANVCSQGESSGGGPITAQQLEQLLRMLPVPSKTGVSDSDDDMEACFAEMVTCM